MAFKKQLVTGPRYPPVAEQEQGKMKYLVKTKSGEVVCEVTQDGGGFMASDNIYIAPAHLAALSLTLEEIKPVKRKLYAYMHKTDGEMRFYSNEQDFTYWTRCPEWDRECEL